MKRRKGPHANTGTRKSVIIQAALKCFSEIGFSATSMEDIRQHSRASTGSIYHHFKGKEQLAAAVYLEGIRTYQAGLMDIFRSSQDAREGIRSLVEYHLRWVEENEDWSRYLFQRRHSGFVAEAEEQIADMNRRLMEEGSKWFARHVRVGTIRRMSPGVFASIVFGPCMEYTRHYLGGQVPAGTGRVAGELAEALWRALAVHAEQSR
jgi:AcrR family transcriptional regulator